MTTPPLLDLQALAHLLGRSPETIRRDLRRNPGAVPPRLQLPGTRLLRWREIDVAAWLEQLAVSKEPRATTKVIAVLFL